MLDKRKSDIWNALGLGPQWVSRSKAESVPSENARPASEPENPPIAQTVASVEPVKPAIKTVSEPASPPHPIAPKKQEPVRIHKPNTRIPPAKTPEESETSMYNRSVSPEAFSPERTQKILSANWDELKQMVRGCRVCNICHGRVNPVFGSGDPKRDLMLIGEAPGFEEDKQGLPFVGISGILLNNILSACGLNREKDVAIYNTLKCRPPNNATPEMEEMLACRPFLERQIELVDPKLIVTMGVPATSCFFTDKKSLKARRSQVYDLEIAGKKRKVIVTFHPAYLLRSPLAKRDAWMDWCLILDTLQGLSNEGNGI